MRRIELTPEEAGYLATVTNQTRALDKRLRDLEELGEQIQETKRAAAQGVSAYIKKLGAGDGWVFENKDGKAALVEPVTEGTIVDETPS